MGVHESLGGEGSYDPAFAAMQQLSGGMQLDPALEGVGAGVFGEAMGGEGVMGGEGGEGRGAGLGEPSPIKEVRLETHTIAYP